MMEKDRAADVPTDDPERRLEALLDDTLDQLRLVVRRSTSQAREDLAAAMAAVEKRADELAALQTAIAAERAHLVADREGLEQRAAEVIHREEAVHAAAADVAELRERATVGLASALERSARLVEEAEAQAVERATRARVEAEAILQRSADRGREIVATAEASAERAHAELRRLVAQIEAFLERAALQIDLDAGTRGGPRDSIGSLIDPATAGCESVEGPEVASDVHDVVVPGDWPAAAFAPVLVPSAARNDGPEPVSAAADTPIDVAAEHRVADAVRRAVRGWTAARQDAE